MTKSIINIKDDILFALLPNVPFDGWRWDMVSHVAVQSGYDKTMATAVFPGKITDVVEHFADWLDRQMLEKLENVNMDDMRVRDRIRRIVMERFYIMQDYRQAEQAALAFWAMPLHSPKAGRVLWRTSDRIWNRAGDTATDYNHYTKRGLLSGVIGSVALVWLNDDSDGLKTTEDFLGRRIENIMQLGRFLGRIKKTVPSFRSNFSEKGL